MKKPLLTLAASAALLAFTANPSEASNSKSKEPKVLTVEDKERLLEIESKVLEIKGLDFSTLTKEEKKELKNELRSLEKEAKARGGSGLYISTGALIVILILLIIIL